MVFVNEDIEILIIILVMKVLIMLFVIEGVEALIFMRIL